MQNYNNLSLNLDSIDDFDSNSIKISDSDITEKYEIKWTKVIGSGMNGDVFICIDKITTEEMALKIITDNDSGLLEVSLHGECQDSAHVVGIRDVFRCQITPPCSLRLQPGVYICAVMELMRGGDLYEHISENNTLSEKHAAYLAKQIAIGLNDIHQKGIAHRDIKPENILFQAPFQKDLHLNTVKISDFGFAKEEGKGMNTPLYTLYYVSPDLINAFTSRSESQVVTYDKRCDAWSLGVIVFIMLMGYPPFYPESRHNAKLTWKMRDAILAGNLMIHNQSQWKAISESGQDVIRGLLTVDPEQRLSLDALLAHPWFY